ncbi:hypothetical protein EDB85DRAFT_2142720 [Lactarius pseudohatsudake]|nr:hypothetical protein EDB85DRAFT_2142720 [Lactarius pseudohatsudake]
MASSSENHYHPLAEMRPRHHSLTPTFSLSQAVGIEYPHTRNLHSDHVKASRVFKQVSVAHDATAKDLWCVQTNHRRVVAPTVLQMQGTEWHSRVPLIALNIPDAIWEYAYDCDTDVGSTSTVHFEYDADLGSRPGTDLQL